MIIQKIELVKLYLQEEDWEYLNEWSRISHTDFVYIDELNTIMLSLSSSFGEDILSILMNDLKDCRDELKVCIENLDNDEYPVLVDLLINLSNQI